MYIFEIFFLGEGWGPRAGRTVHPETLAAGQRRSLGGNPSSI